MMPDLIEELSKLPESLALVAVNGSKAPYQSDWQKRPLDKAAIEKEIRSLRCKAVGVLCGVFSGGLLFLDHDGASCDALIEKLSNGQILPKTVGVASGRPGRFQLIYKVPEQFHQAIETKRLKTKQKGEDGKDELLEFRWDGCQSVVAGAHPTTGEYQYLPGQSFAECEIAEAPMWMIEQMLVQEPVRQKPTRSSTNKDVIPLERCLSKKHRELLESGEGEGSRDNTGAALARDLIGTANYLRDIGQAFDGDPYDLLAQYCSRCNPPLGSRDCDRIYKSAEKDDPDSCLSSDKIDNCIEAWERNQRAPRKTTTVVKPPVDLEDPGDVDPPTTFLQYAKAHLFKGHWISFGDILYEWVGNYYKLRPDEALSPVIQRYANKFQVVKTDAAGNTTTTYPHAKPKSVKEVLEWVKLGCAVTADQVNPPGVNCTNGVLLLEWQGETLRPRLIKHSPDRYYLSEPRVTYNPDADSSEYERLMQCLDSDSREIWERTIAASLDLSTVRKFKGRAVKAALLKGDGSNGKDALRTLVQMVFGSGAMSSCTATDFRDYDSGRKFPLFELRGKRLNWPSENADAGRIDQFRALRAAITGDPIAFEQKNKPVLPAEPLETIFLFNVNEAPNIVAQLQATSSRWTLIPFNKTFANNPVAGQLQADPRFKEDPQFIKDKILPAFLNRLIQQLQAVVLEGIDYSCTQNLFEEMQRENSHLLQFAHDVGLRYDPTGSVTVKELWDKLRSWYIETGTLVIEESVNSRGIHKEKATWNDQARQSDRNVKGSNQVAQRFLEIFPKARKGMMTVEGSHNPQAVITKIKICPPTDQGDQDGQEPDSKNHTGEGSQLPAQKHNWVGTDQELGRNWVGDDQAELTHSYPVEQESYPVKKLGRSLEPIQDEHSPTHPGHPTQFDDKILFSEQEVTDCDDLD
jgi:phage/plasmid-associated DNA primase